MLIALIARLKKGWKKGVTLVEMMVAVSIFVIVTSVVIYNYGDFNSNILVSNLAYEMALAMREAQVYGLSVKQAQQGAVCDPSNGVCNDYAYGVYIDISNPKMFYLYADNIDPNGIMDGSTSSCGQVGAECQESFEIRGDVTITDICTQIGTNTECGKDKLNALFLRPNPEAIIFADNDAPDVDELYGGSPLTLDVKTATVTLQSSRSGKQKIISIERTGQIAVQDPQ